MADMETHAQAWERRERRYLWRALSERGVDAENDPALREAMISWANSYASLYAREVIGIAAPTARTLSVSQ